MSQEKLVIKEVETEDTEVTLQLSFKIPNKLNEQQVSNFLTEQMKLIKSSVLKQHKEKQKNIKIEFVGKVENQKKQTNLFSTEPKKNNCLRFVHISDTHNKTCNVPPGDVLLHTGDFTLKGTEEEVKSFNKWLGTLPHQYKVVICGNHETCLDPAKDEDYLLNRQLLTNATHFLFDEMVVIRGIKIYGTPYQKEFHKMAFNLEKSEDIEEKMSNIPTGLDILMVHAPPKNKLDLYYKGENVGCEILAKAVEEKKPKYCLFGHIHESNGVLVDKDTIYMNGAVCNRKYKPNNPINYFDLECCETDENEHIE